MPDHAGDRFCRIMFGVVRKPHLQRAPGDYHHRQGIIRLPASTPGHSLYVEPGGSGHQVPPTFQGDVFKDQERIKEGFSRRDLTPFLNLIEWRVLVFAQGHLLLL